MVIVKGKWFVPQSITLPIPRKFGKLGIEYLTFLHTKCSGCFPCQVLMFRRTYEFLGVFSATFPSSAARNRLSFLEERVWSDPSPIEDLLTSSNLKDIASSAVAADLMDLSLPSFDSFPMTEEEIRRAEALKKKAEDAQPLVVIRSTEGEVEAEEPPMKKSRLNPPSSGKGKVPSKSRGKKAEDEVRAFVLAETGAPWTPSFTRADKSVLHSGDSVITNPSAALAVARGMWLPKNEEAISQRGLEQLLPSAPVRAIESLYHTMALCATAEAQSLSIKKLEKDLDNAEKRATTASTNLKIASEAKDVYKRQLAASETKVDSLQAEVQRLTEALTTCFKAGKQMQGRYSCLAHLVSAKAFRSGYNQGSGPRTMDPDAFDKQVGVHFPYDEGPEALEAEIRFAEMVKAHLKGTPSSSAPAASIPPTPSPTVVDAFESTPFDLKRK
ncbi:uncharacterized protein LOC132298861 [Cornus florida]|uniref:uncharacterized protein LOC132298861 n=1 Tax=Cornus florida TaxID=4283 RepID=UPI00289EAF3E|nr:uncharacterized protein LOC132298861 [Cornus florida]